MDAQKIGNAQTHHFETNDTTVYNVGVKRTDVEKLSAVKGYLNLVIAGNDTKALEVVVNPYLEGGDKVKNAHVFLNIDKEKLLALEDSKGWINFSVAPKKEQENVTDNKVNLSVYQSQGKDQEKKTAYIGNAYAFESNALGTVFKDHNEKGNFTVYNALLNKNAILTVPTSKEDVLYVNIAPISDKENTFIVYQSKEKNDKKAAFTLSLNPSKLNLITADDKGNIRITFSEKLKIGIDNANLNVISTESLKQGHDKFYVGKGWDTQHMTWNKDNNTATENFLNAGDPVQFKISNDFYLNKAFGAIDHIAHGTVSGLTQEGKVEVSSVCGNFVFEKENLLASSSDALNNFDITYNNEKSKHASKQLEQKESTSLKDSTKKNTADKAKDNIKTKSKTNTIKAKKSSKHGMER